MLKLIEITGPEVYKCTELYNETFTAFTCGRRGGVSKPPYDTLNISGYLGDDPRNVKENRGLVLSRVGVDRLWTPVQVHGDKVAIIDSPDLPKPYEADAVIVSAPNIAVGVLTADCLPIILAAPITKVAAVIHAGRRGTELYIASKTVDLMVRRFAVEPDEIVATLGPCIRSCCYEVDWKTATHFHTCCGSEKSREIELTDANTKQLLGAGILKDNIFEYGICVSCENHRFFSYRKDGKKTGRFLSGIFIKE